MDRNIIEQILCPLTKRAKFGENWFDYVFVASVIGMAVFFIYMLCFYKGG